jgi:hypothetical protein
MGLAIRKCAQVSDACLTSLSVVSPKYRLGLLSAGYLWLLALPLSQLAVSTYIDENALQPSQVPLSPPAHIMCVNHVRL